MADKKCAECGAPFSGAGAVDPYKHTIGCLHVEDQGREHLLKVYGDSKSDHALRVVANLTAAKG